MGNLDLYSKVASVPADAKKTIKGGKLNGFTDINPMWRIKTLTEQFGVVGFGWKYYICDMWKEESPLCNEVAVNVRINLYVKMDGEWSEPIVGIGGSKLIAVEKGTPVMSDEAYKMALTDALSVACKALGMGADVYWSKDEDAPKDATKYARNNDTPKADGKPADNLPTEEQIEILHKYGVYSLDGIGAWLHKPTEELTYDDVQMAINAKLSEKKKGAKKSA